MEYSDYLEELVVRGTDLLSKVYVGHGGSIPGKTGLPMHKVEAGTKALTSLPKVLLLECQQDSRSAYFMVSILEKGLNTFLWGPGMAAFESRGPEHHNYASSLIVPLTIRMHRGHLVITYVVKSILPGVGKVPAQGFIDRLFSQTEAAADYFLDLQESGFQHLKELSRQDIPDVISVSSQFRGDYYLTAPKNWGADWGDSPFYIDKYE